MSAPATPVMGIRLRGGKLPPPAPSFGRHRPIHAGRVRLGFTNENRPGEVVPVCGECRIVLDPRATPELAAEALYGHWEAEHAGEAA